MYDQMVSYEDSIAYIANMPSSEDSIANVWQNAIFWR